MKIHSPLNPSLRLRENALDGPAKNEVRLLYYMAAYEKKHCEKLINLLQPYTEKSNPLWAGYKASAIMMMAKYTLNPFRKLSLFSNGRDLLEKCIASDKDNVELRFLRLATQISSPPFLGFRNEIQQDKKFLHGACLQLNDFRLKESIRSLLTM